MNISDVPGRLAGGAAALACAAALAGAGAAAAPAATASVVHRPAAACALCGRNVILNSGADLGPGTNDDSVVKVPDWKGTVGFTAAQYAWGGGDLSATTPGPHSRGKNYFYGGPDSARSTGTQVLAIAAGSLPAGTGYELSGWLGGYSSQGDDCTLTATFESAAGTPLASATIGPVTAAQRHDNSELVLRRKSGSVPAGTRSVKLVLVMVRDAGSDNDGMADTLSLVFSAA